MEAWSQDLLKPGNRRSVNTSQPLLPLQSVQCITKVYNIYSSIITLSFSQKIENAVRVILTNLVLLGFRKKCILSEKLVGSFLKHFWRANDPYQGDIFDTTTNVKNMILQVTSKKIFIAKIAIIHAAQLQSKPMAHTK